MREQAQSRSRVKQGVSGRTPAAHPAGWRGDQDMPGLIRSCPEQTSRHILHPLAMKDRGVILEDRRQRHAPVQRLVVKTKESASDVVCTQNSLVIVDREQNRY